FLRCKISKNTSGYPVRKSNVLLVGSSGTGKTLLAQTIATYMDLPFIIIDATILSNYESSRSNTESILKILYTRVGDDIELAEHGIVFIDEIDKIKKIHGQNDSAGEKIQQGLLKLLEGSKLEFSVPGVLDRPISIDTRNILFICAGTFVGLEDIVRDRLKYERWVERDTLLMKTESEDLIKYGMIPELVARIPLIAPLHDLSVSDLYRIISEPKDSLLNEYKILFEQYGVDLNFAQDALEQIARESLKTGNGARGLRLIFEIVLLNYMYNKNYGNNTLLIDSIIVENEVNRERKKDELKNQLKSTEQLLQKCLKELEILGTRAPAHLMNKTKGLEAKIQELNKQLNQYP
ncbi:MAG: hypothetical protein A2161_01045, partial [Candidatus Schekmanbacteria bacterium RBG_13_48_7]